MSITKRGFYAPAAVRLDPGSEILLKRLTEREDFMISQKNALESPRDYLNNTPENKANLIERLTRCASFLYLYFIANTLNLATGPINLSITTEQIMRRIHFILNKSLIDAPARYKEQILFIVKNSMNWLESRINEILGGKNIYKQVFEKAIYERI